LQELKLTSSISLAATCGTRMNFAIIVPMEMRAHGNPNDPAFATSLSVKQVIRLLHFVCDVA